MIEDWASTSFRHALATMVRRRVPASEVDDIVQQTLVEVVSSSQRPDEPEALRKWIFGIARNKVVDYHRRAQRETFDVPELGTEASADVEDLLRWAMRELPPGSDANETLDWLLREGDGEKLEAIADDADVPAPRVRKRVSRLRQHFRSRRAAEFAALAALGIAGVVLFLWLRKEHEEEPIVRVVEPTPEQRGREERLRGLEACRAELWDRCVEGLDRAKALDPAGDDAPEVVRARKAAAEHRSPAPTPSSEPTAPAPTTERLAPEPETAPTSMPVTPSIPKGHTTYETLSGDTPVSTTPQARKTTTSAPPPRPTSTETLPSPSPTGTDIVGPTKPNDPPPYSGARKP